MRWHQIAKPDRVFSMMIDEVLFVAGWQTAHGFSLPNRLMPRFGVRRRIFDDESHHRIDLGERFLRRRFSGCLDHLLTADLFRPFLKRFVLITIGATCHCLAGMHLELPRRFDPGSFYVFQNVRSIGGTIADLNQRAHARHRLSARPNELPVLLEPSGRRAGVSLHERNRLEPAPFEHPEDPGPNRAPRNAGRCGPRETILCPVRRSLVPDGDRPDQIGADVRCRAGSGSNRRNLHVEVYHSFRKSGTATLPW